MGARNDRLADIRGSVTLLGLIGFLLIVQLGYFQSFDHRLGAVCTILALYDFAAAKGYGDQIVSALDAKWHADLHALSTPQIADHERPLLFHPNNAGAA